MANCVDYSFLFSLTRWC